jgi:SWI/SNF-related matrix-associated actin-dependent regulator 1 of chromatin subfamily A
VSILSRRLLNNQEIIMDEKTILSLASWTNPKEVQTKYGPRYLREAAKTEAFSAAWREHKDEMKALGATWTKDERTGEWSLVWWQQIPAEELAKRAASVEASRAVSADIDLPHPDGLDYMPFQKAGIRYALDRDGVLIGDEMGLGKTIQAIGIINADLAVDSALVICPKSLKLNWYRELTKWLTKPLTVGIADGHWPSTQIVIVNYEALGKFFELATERTWSVCVVDEAHYIKNKKSQRSINVKAIARKARRNVRMTGTPIVNRPIELYNIICDLHPAWANWWQYAKKYCNAIDSGYGLDVSGNANLDELQKKLRETVMVRRLKKDVLTELPKKIRQIIEVECDETGERAAVRAESDFEARSEARLADLRAAVELSKAESDEAYQAAVERLREASTAEFTEMSKLRHETALVKVPAVLEHVRTILEDDADQKIFLAAHHHDVIEQLGQGLLDFYPVTLTGETKLEDRQKAVDRFQTDPACRVFIGSITAAGVGITLTAANLVIFAELDWVPGNVTQCEDRCHRIGQTMPVLVQHIVLKDSIDARMANVLVSKQAVIDQALDVKHPERQQPVYQPRNAAATHGATVDDLASLATKMTDRQREAVQGALRQLAFMDVDHASEWNGQGFNKLDSRIGHDLAERGSLTPKQAALGMRLVKKYSKQLPDEINQVLRGEQE